MPAPSSATSNITHNDAKLVVHSKEMTENGEMVLDFTYMTDGTESTNELMGAPMTSTVKWDGDTLTFDSKGKFSDTDFTLKDKWTISDDGKTLSMDRAITSSMGESPQTLIFEKK